MKQNLTLPNNVQRQKEIEAEQEIIRQRMEIDRMQLELDYARLSVAKEQADAMLMQAEAKNTEVLLNGLQEMYKSTSGRIGDVVHLETAEKCRKLIFEIVSENRDFRRNMLQGFDQNANPEG